MIARIALAPAAPPLNRDVAARAITGFGLLNQLDHMATVIVPLGRINVVGPAESRVRANEVLELWGHAMRQFATWAASAIDSPTLVIGTEVFRSESDEGPPLFVVRAATIEERATAFAEFLRSPRGLQLRRRDADTIAAALDGLTQVVAGELAARRP